MLGTTMLTTKFDYNAVANTRILDGAAKLSDAELDAPTGYSVGSLRETIYHTLIVEYGWRSQCQGVDARQLPPPIAPTNTLDTLRAFQQEEHARARTYVASLSDDNLAETLSLRDRAGKEYAYARWQILTHILYHSAQHRSEMAELLTRHGQSPGDLDFIFYIKNGLQD